MQENHRGMASLEFPNVTVKLEDEEEVPWVPNNQGSEENENFPGSHSEFPVPKTEVIHGGDPWIPEPVSEEREIPTDYGSELPDVIIKLEQEEDPYVPYRQVSEAGAMFKGAQSAETSLTMSATSISHEESTLPIQDMKLQKNEKITFLGWRYRHYFILRTAGSDLTDITIRNISVSCKLCLPSRKPLSTAKNTTSNLLKHLTTVHATTKLTPLAPDAGDKPTPSKQMKLDNFTAKKPKPITSSKLQSLLAAYIVEDVKPVSIVESPAFKHLISELCQNTLAVPSRPTMTSFIDARFEKMNEKLLQELFEAEYICTTADIWSASNRSFFGMTAHWINTKTLSREKAALACCRFTGCHTYDAIAEKLYEVHSEYNLTPKLTATVTNNGSNFVKAFALFQEVPAEGNEYADEDNMESDEEDDTDFADIGNILQDPENSNQEADVSLPPHKRCASHTFSLIGKDVEKAMSRGNERNTYRSAMAKCSAMWNKARRSALVADIIEEHAEVKLVVPTETRWNSQFSAICKIVKIAQPVLKSICNKLQLPYFSDQELSLLGQYSAVVQPLAEALDLLQGETHCFYGTLLPVLYTLQRKLAKVKEEKSLPLVPGLVDAITAAIEQRFSSVFEENDAKLAAVSNPSFKTMWTQSSDEKQALRKLLWEEMERMAAAQVAQSNSRASSTPDSHSYERNRTNEGNFFDFQHDNNTDDDVEMELNSYLKSCKSISALHQYPTVKKIFLKHNTTLPSSAPVEHLFSLGGLVLTPKRNGLSDKHFEKLLLMRYNKHFL